MSSTEPDSSLRSRVRTLAGQAATFVREFADGIDKRGMQRLFDQEASQAFRTLADRRGDEERSSEGFRGFLEDVRDVGRGMVLKLSPARRVLFVAALVCPILAALEFDFDLSRTHIQFDAGPFWYLLSIAALILLLALELVDRLRVRDELEVARQLQRDLLPQESPDMVGWRIAHSYRTANEIGGDYYDFLPLPDGRMVIAVGDASGHGIGAGLLMAIGNAALETAVDLDPTPAAVIKLLGRTLYRTGGRRAFMTVFYGVLDPDTGKLDWANAGHPYPLLRRKSGALEELGEGSLPLGVKLDPQASEGTLYVEEGDLLVLYSDGIPEAETGADPLGRARADFGFERLRSLVAACHDADQAHFAVMGELDRFVGESSLRDDVTLVALSRHAVPPPPPL